jgi:hypothetical protein
MAEGAVKIDQALTNLSVAYRNGTFIGDRVFPVVPVAKQSDKYFVHGKELFNVLDDRRSAGSEAHLSRWTLSSSPFYCEGHALKDFVPREDQVNADPQLDLLVDTTEVLTQQVLLNQEVNLVAALAAGLTGVSLEAQTSSHWDDDTKDPLTIIKAQILEVGLRIGVPPNVMAFSAPVWSAVTMNAKVKALITGAGNVASALITPAQIAAYLGLDEILVGSAVKNTANQGQTTSLGWVWGETACLFYRPPNPGRKTLSLGYTFQWNGAFGAGQAQFVNRYFWQPNLADVVEVHKYYDQRMIDSGAGALFTDCLT